MIISVWHVRSLLVTFFLITGNIKNTEKLNYGKERMYKLTVTAYDCGKNRASEDVLVKINIKPTCKPTWQGIKDLWDLLSLVHSNKHSCILLFKAGKLSYAGQFWSFVFLEHQIRILE